MGVSVCCRLVEIYLGVSVFFFFFSSRRRHTRCSRDWSSDVCSSDLAKAGRARRGRVDLPQRRHAVGAVGGSVGRAAALDRKSTRLNSSHGYISYAVFCLKKKKTSTEDIASRTHTCDTPTNDIRLKAL